MTSIIAKSSAFIEHFKNTEAGKQQILGAVILAYSFSN